MNPEIKAAIEKRADEVSRTVFQPCLRSMLSRTIANENGKELYKAGAEYGYKLAEQQIEESERNYRDMLKIMTDSVGGCKAGKDLAIEGLKEILLCWPEYNSGLTAKRYLKKLGEL